jgi:HK97 gp10 family phage protein
MSIGTTGARLENWQGEKIIAQAKTVAYKSAFDCGIACMSMAKLFCPVDSGRLRSSISVLSKSEKYNTDTGVSTTVDTDEVQIPPADEYTVFVGTNVDYATFQEFGTIKMGAQPFLRPAMDYVSGKALEIAMVDGKMEFAEYLQT